MNRREMLAGLVASAAAVDVAATASVIEAEPKPLLLVLKINRPLSSEAHLHIRKHWAKITEGSELPP